MICYIATIAYPNTSYNWVKYNCSTSDRYGVNPGNTTTSVIRTFQYVITGGRNDTDVRRQPEASQLVEQLLSAANPLIKSFERK